MEVGLVDEGVDEVGGDQALVEDQVGEARVEEIEGGRRRGEGEGVDPVEGDRIGAPIAGILPERDSVVDPPAVQDVGAVRDELARLDPVVAPFLERGEVDRGEGREAADVEEERGRRVEGDPKGPVVGGLDSDLVEIEELPPRL